MSSEGMYVMTLPRPRSGLVAVLEHRCGLPMASPAQVTPRLCPSWGGFYLVEQGQPQVVP